MTQAKTTYELPADMLQAAVHLLGEMPAVRSRALLNAIEAECRRLDGEHELAERNRVRAELQAELAQTTGLPPAKT